MDIYALLEKYRDELKERPNVKMPVGCFWPPPPLRHTPITPRENYLKFCRKEKPVFMAIDTDEFMLSPKIFPDAIARAFVVDNEGIDPKDFGGKDMFGIDWVYVEQVGGSMVRPGKPKVEDIEEWEKYITFPDIDSWDWEESGRRNKDLVTREFATNIWIMNGLFERLISFLDFEDAAVALIDEDQKEAVHRFFDKLTDLYERMITKIKETYDVDVIYFHDDWGSQRSSFFSLDVCREMVMPYLKRVVDATHNNGMIFNFHSCGKCGNLIPAMIEAGVDVWCPQPMNDFKYLYDNYGKEITIGVTLPAPPVDAAMEEVVETCQKFLDDYTGEKGYAFPVIYEPEYHEKFLEVLYVLSREKFAE